MNLNVESAFMMKLKFLKEHTCIRKHLNYYPIKKTKFDVESKEIIYIYHV